MKALAGGAPACVTVTLLDGLVLARSAFHHSMNYRSVVVVGTATEIIDPAEKLRALEAIVEHVAPGRARERAPALGEGAAGDAGRDAAARRGVGQGAHGPAEGRRGGLRARRSGRASCRSRSSRSSRSPTPASRPGSRCRRTSRAGGGRGASVLRRAPRRAPGRRRPARPFAEERLLLDRRLETLRRILPDGPTASADVLLVRDLAEGARLARVEIQPRPPVESGARGEVVLDVTRPRRLRGDRPLLPEVAVSHRLVDVESLTLTATGENVIQLAAVLRFPYWPARAPLPPPPESPRGRPAGVPRPTADAFLRDQSLAFAKSDAIAAPAARAAQPAALPLRARRRGARAAGGARLRLARGGVHGARARDRRGAGTRLREPARAGLPPRLGVPHGEAGRLPPLRGPRHEPGGGARRGAARAGGRPVRAGPRPCRVDRDAARSIVVKGRAPTAKDPGRGPLTLRLRDVDFADVFQALAVLGARRLRGPGGRRGAREPRGDARHPRRDPRRDPQGVGRRDLRRRAGAGRLHPGSPPRAGRPDGRCRPRASP